MILVSGTLVYSRGDEEDAKAEALAEEPTPVQPAPVPDVIRPVPKPEKAPSSTSRLTVLASHMFISDLPSWFAAVCVRRRWLITEGTFLAVWKASE